MLRASPASHHVVQNNFLGDNNYNNYAADATSPAEPHAVSAAVYPLVPSAITHSPDTNIAEYLEENRHTVDKVDIRKRLGEISHAQTMDSRAMEPRIPEGSLLFLRDIKAWDEALLDGTVYGVDIARPHMIVRKVYDDGEFIRCEPINSEFGSVRVPKSKVLNLYKIVAVLKIYK